jgi:hypothetical protein
VTQQNVLRNLTTLIEFAKAKKPEWATPLAVLLVIELLTVTDAEGQSNVGIEWLSQRTSACRRTIEHALSLLAANGWVVKVSGKQNYRTSTYTVQVNNLPVHHDTKRGAISAAAMTAAMHYHGMVKALPKVATKNGRMRSIRVAKNWETHWGYVAQGWLDEGYDLEHIKDAIDRAFQVKSWSYCHGLHTLKTDFVRLLKSSGWTVATENGYLLTVK